MMALHKPQMCVRNVLGQMAVFQVKMSKYRAFITIQLLTGWSGTSTAGMYYIHLYKKMDICVMIINEIANRIVFHYSIFRCYSTADSFYRSS